MHNALRWFLLWTLFPFVIVAADPPPPLVRSVLTTNLCPFGTVGWVLTRISAPPYLAWSNVTSGTTIDTNAFQPASVNLTNWSLISTNALTGKLDSNAYWMAWGSIATNALTTKLDSNVWWASWGSLDTNALTGKLDSNWWWMAYGGKVLTNSGSFIASHLGNGTNTTFWQSNTVVPPVVIKPVIGTTTNRFEIQDTNGNPKVVVDSQGRVGIGTNLLQALLEVVGTNSGSGDLFRVGNLSIASKTNAFSVKTNLVQINQPIQCDVDLTYDWGTSGGNRPKDVYGGTFQANTILKFGSRLSGNGHWGMWAPVDWIARFSDVNSGNTVFTSLEYSNTLASGNLYVTNGTTSNGTNYLAGYTGLGTNGPQSRLHVTGDNSAPNVLQVDTTNRHDLLVVNTNGHVGIGTNNPQAVLHVTGTNGPSQYIVQVENPMVANKTNVFVITTNGNVGIGTNPGSTYSLEVGSYAFFDQAIYFGNGRGIIQTALFDNSNVRVSALGGRGAMLNCDDDETKCVFVSTNGGGSVGVLTNSPQSSFQIAARNQFANVIQAGTTNRPTLLTLTTNGVLSVNPGGGINPVGCYGALMMNATNIVVCAGAASVYTNIAGTGYTTIVTNGFYGDTNGNSSALTNLYAGYYRVQAAVSYVGANAGAYEAEVFTNNVSCDLIGWKDTFDTPARLRNGGAVGIIYLPAGCRTSVRIQDGGAGSSISIQRTSLVIGTP